VTCRPAYRGQLPSKVDYLAGAGDEGRLLQQVGWRIAADAKFGEEDEVSASLLGSASEFEYLLSISVKVTDGGIDLGERDLHIVSLTIGPGGRFGLL